LIIRDLVSSLTIIIYVRNIFGLATKESNHLSMMETSRATRTRLHCPPSESGRAPVDAFRRGRGPRGLVIWNLLLACELRLPNRRSIMAIASYEVVGSGGVWRVKHDGEPVGSYQTKESAFEAAVAAASLAVREGYEVQLSVPGTRIES
jgi:hypothetical protein